MKSDIVYLEKIQEVIRKIEKEQENIKAAAKIMADSIYKGRIVYLFGSGHSIIPCMDIFPRWGTFVGFEPIVEGRLGWTRTLGPGGTRQVLWIERQEGYVKEVLKNYNMQKDDTMIVFSHGGNNAAPTDMALLCKEKGMKVITVTCGEYLKISKTSHSSGKRVADIADIVIDNCAPIEDTIVDIENLDYKVAGTSTVTAIIISMSLVAETAKILTKRGMKLDVFVSLLDKNVEPDHNDKVYKKYVEKVYKNCL